MFNPKSDSEIPSLSFSYVLMCAKMNLSQLMSTTLLLLRMNIIFFEPILKFESMCLIWNKNCSDWSQTCATYDDIFSRLWTAPFFTNPYNIIFIQWKSSYSTSTNLTYCWRLCSVSKPGIVLMLKWFSNHSSLVGCSIRTSWCVKESFNMEDVCFNDIVNSVWTEPGLPLDFIMNFQQLSGGIDLQ